MRIPATLLALLLLTAPALAHGDGPKHFVITDQGCSLSEPPCILAPDGASVVAGATTTVRFTNDLEATQDVMVHIDDDGAPGSLIAGVTPAAPGATIDLEFDVPADATGVWYMTIQGSDESARLFGTAVADDHGEGEDSPGAGVVLLLGVLAVAVALRRR